MLIPLDDIILCDIFLERIRPSKKLQSDIHEFNRTRDDDPQKNLWWLTNSIDRLLQKGRMLNARALQTKPIQPGAPLTNDNSASSSAVPAQDKDKGKGEGKGRGKGKGKGGASDKSNGVGHIPIATGIRSNYARLGKCEKDDCAFQHPSAGQLRKALGGETRQSSGSAVDRQQSKSAGRGQSQGAGNHKSKGKGKVKHKSDAAPSKEVEGKIDTQALPAVVRRQLSRPRWCSDFLKGCSTKNPCPFPHYTETVVAEIKEKEAYSKSAGAGRSESTTGKRSNSRGRKSNKDS